MISSPDANKHGPPYTVLAFSHSLFPIASTTAGSSAPGWIQMCATRNFSASWMTPRVIFDGVTIDNDVFSVAAGSLKFYTVGMPANMSSLGWTGTTLLPRAMYH